jgi:hypothetical protein
VVAVLVPLLLRVGALHLVNVPRPADAGHQHVALGDEAIRSERRLKDRRDARKHQPLRLAASVLATRGHENPTRPEIARERLDFIPLLDEVKLEFRQLELVLEVRLVQLEPRVFRAHLEFKKRRLRNQHAKQPTTHRSTPLPFDPNSLFPLRQVAAACRT